MNLTQKLGPRATTLFGLLFSMVFVVPGAVLTYLGAQELYQGYTSTYWPTVNGEVIQSSMGSSDPGARRRQRVYSADVTYSYRIGNEAYTASRVSFGDYSDSGGRYAGRVLSRYSRGDQVTVHYEPGDPSNAVLEPGVHGRTWFKPLFGLVFFVIGLVVAVVIYRRGEQTG